MRANNKGSLTLGAFLFLIGLFFTVFAPGGLGEVTMVAGVLIMTIYATAPKDPTGASAPQPDRMGRP